MFGYKQSTLSALVFAFMMVIESSCYSYSQASNIGLFYTHHVYGVYQSVLPADLAKLLTTRIDYLPIVHFRHLAKPSCEKVFQQDQVLFRVNCKQIIHFYYFLFSSSFNQNMVIFCTLNYEIYLKLQLSEGKVTIIFIITHEIKQQTHSK